MERIQAALFQLGLIAIGVQEPATAEHHFTSVVETLSSKSSHPRCINLLLASHNQLGLLWAERLDNVKGKKELLESSQLYKSYKDSESAIPPTPINDLFLKVKNDCENENTADGCITTVSDLGEETDAEFPDGRGQWENFEELHTYTLFYLAQVCGNLGECCISV